MRTLAQNGKPHKPKGEPLHALPGGQHAPEKSTQPEGYVAARRTTRRVRLFRDKKSHIPKGATGKTAQQEVCKPPDETPHRSATCSSRTNRRVRRSQRHLDRDEHEEEPHDPEGASLHLSGNATFAPDGAAQPEGCVARAALGASLVREETRTARMVRQNKPRNNKGANHDTPLCTAQPLARAAQPGGCVAPCGSLCRGAARPGERVARATIGRTRPRYCRTTRRARRSTQSTVLRVRKRQPHYPERGSLQIPFGVVCVRGEPHKPLFALLDPHNLRSTSHQGSWRGQRAPA